MNNTQGRFVVALLALLWAAMIIGVFRGWTPGVSKSKRVKALVHDRSGNNSLEIIESSERNWFSTGTSQNFDSVVWKTNGPNGPVVKEIYGPERFELPGPFRGGFGMRGPSEIHSFDAARSRAILKMIQLQTNRATTFTAVYSWYDWDLAHGTGVVLQVCKQPFDPYLPTVTNLSSLEAAKNPATNIVSMTLPAATNNQAGSVTVITVTTGRTVLPRILP